MTTIYHVTTDSSTRFNHKQILAGRLVPDVPDGWSFADESVNLASGLLAHPWMFLERSFCERNGPMTLSNQVQID